MQHKMSLSRCALDNFKSLQPSPNEHPVQPVEASHLVRK